MEKYYLKTVPLLRKNKENIYNFENNLFLLDIIFSFYCDRNSINNDYTQKMHAHSYYEMHIILEGESTFELPSKRLLSLKKGDFIIFPTDYKHRITYESNRFSKISVSFNFSPKETPEKNFYQVAKKHIQDPAIIGLNQQMSNHCDTIIYNIEKKPYDYTSIIFFSMIQLIIESFRLKVGDAEIEYAEFFTDNRIKAATDFIKENINASLNVQDVANHVHLSAKQLVRQSNRFSKISVSFNFSPKETPEKNFYQVAKKHIQDPAIIGLNQQMSNHCDTIIYNIEKKPYDYTSIIFFSMIQLIIESFRLKVGDAEIEYAEFFTDNRIKAATDFIKENINASLNVQDVANHVHLSAKQLVRLFKKETSTTPGEYIKSQKIACIREMIANDMNIKDIVYAMGYSDYTSLIKFYKRYSGDSLASYKKTLAYKEKTAEQSMMI